MGWCSGLLISISLRLKLWYNTKTETVTKHKNSTVTILINNNFDKVSFKSILDRSHLVRKTWRTWQPMRCAQGSLLRSRDVFGLISSRQKFLNKIGFWSAPQFPGKFQNTSFKKFHKRFGIGSLPPPRPLPPFGYWIMSKVKLFLFFLTGGFPSLDSQE